VGAHGAGQSANYWISIMKDGAVGSDIDDNVLLALLKRLADLGVFENCGDELWALANSEGPVNRKRDEENFSLQFKRLKQEERGFILKYFTGENLPHKDISLPFMDPGVNKDENKIKISSNLSNYQIVRKMGRQLSPFIEFENSVLKRLEGRHVTRDDAKILFRFMFSKMRPTEKPRQWEQISRRRHK